MPRGEHFRDPKNRGPGRAKGQQNHTTVMIKDLLRESLTRAGGVEYLLRCARKNKNAYLNLIGRLIPGDIQAAALKAANDAAPDVKVNFTVAEVKAEDF
jgi:hypothetical protein